MKLIDRYLSKSIFYPTVAIIIVLSLIILITQSLKYVDLMVSYGISVFDFIKVTFLLLPSLLFIITPVCLFIAIIYSLNKLATQRELNIMKGIGISNFYISFPILRVVILITIFHYFLSLYLMPLVNHNFKELTKNLKESYISFFLQEKVFNHPTEFLTFYIKNKIGENKYEDIFYQDSHTGNVVTFIANEAELIKKDGNVYINFIEGNRQELNEKDELVVLYFDSLLVQLHFKKENNSARIKSMQEKSIGELFSEGVSGDYQTKIRMTAEVSHRIIWPIYNIILSMIAIAALIQGEYARRGNTKRIIIFSVFAGIIVIINNGLISLGANHLIAIILSYIFTFSVLGFLLHFLFYRQTNGF